MTMHVAGKQVGEGMSRSCAVCGDGQAASEREDLLQRGVCLTVCSRGKVLYLGTRVCGTKASVEKSPECV